jgi:ketosteroid isomerase-like protein
MPKPIEIVKAAVEDWMEKGSIGVLMSNVTDDVVYRASAPATTPVGGEFHGREGVIDHFRRLFELVEVSEAKPEGFLEMGHKIVMLGSEKHRLRSTGEVFLIPFCAIFTFRSERISELFMINDYSHLASASSLFLSRQRLPEIGSFRS